MLEYRRGVNLGRPTELGTSGRPLQVGQLPYEAVSA